MKMHARKTGWLVERTERILYICDVKKRAEAYSFVQRISRRAHPVPSRGFLSFLRPIDYPRYYLLSRLSTVSLRTCGLSRERKWRISDASKDRTRRHHRRGSSIVRVPRHVDLPFFFTLFFFLSFYSSIRFRKKWINPASYSGFVEREREYRFPIRVG